MYISVEPTGEKFYFNTRSFIYGNVNLTIFHNDMNI